MTVPMRRGLPVLLRMTSAFALLSIFLINFARQSGKAIHAVPSRQRDTAYSSLKVLTNGLTGQLVTSTSLPGYPIYSDLTHWTRRLC